MIPVRVRGENMTSRKLKSRADPDFAVLGNAFESAPKIALSSLNVDGNVYIVLQKFSLHIKTTHYQYHIQVTLPCTVSF